MYLSLETAHLLLMGLAALDPSEQFEPRAAKKIYSALRTRTKVDLGVYTPADARVQIPRAGPAPHLSRLPSFYTRRT
jgi:hypothetical protein